MIRVRVQTARRDKRLNVPDGPTNKSPARTGLPAVITVLVSSPSVLGHAGIPASFGPQEASAERGLGLFETPMLALRSRTLKRVPLTTVSGESGCAREGYGWGSCDACC